MDEPTLKADGQAEQELTKIHRAEWQDEFFIFAIGFMRNVAIAGLLIVGAFGLIHQIGLVEGSLLSLAALLGLATGGRRLWRRFKSLYYHPGGPTHLHLGARKSDTDKIESDG